MEQRMTRAYSDRIGLMADAPNFPAAWDEVVEKVKIADEIGYDSIWLGESWGYELFTSMSDLARATKRIKIGAGIANIARATFGSRQCVDSITAGIGRSLTIVPCLQTTPAQ